MRFARFISAGSAVTAILVLLLGGPAAGAAGTSAFESLRNPLTARQTVWGGLSASAVEGAGMLRANPAGLAGEVGPAFSTSYQTWQFGLQQHWAGGVLPLGQTAVAAEVAAVHAGSLPSFDAEGNRLGAFTPAEVIVGIGMQRALGERISIGVAAHALRLTGVGEEMSGFAAGAGVQIQLWGTRWGACIRNLGRDVEGVTGEYALPAELCLGLERFLGRGATIALGATADHNREVRFHGGARWEAPGGVALLAGAAYHEEWLDRPFSPRAGVELDLRAVSVSYGYVPEGDLGTIHHLSLRFPGAKNRPPATAAPLPAAPSATPIAAVSSASTVEQTQPSWSVWGGTYRSEAGARAEVRALRVERIDHAEVVPTPDGLFRVRIAGRLPEAEARMMARRLRAACSEE